jgi:hypothetical protein
MPQAGMGDAVRQWLHAIASQAVAALATIRQRWQATDPPLCGPADPKPYPDSETADIVRRETDAEAAEPKESMAVPV